MFQLAQGLAELNRPVRSTPEGLRPAATLRGAQIEELVFPETVLHNLDNETGLLTYEPGRVAAESRTIFKIRSRSSPTSGIRGARTVSVP